MSTSEPPRYPLASVDHAFRVLELLRVQPTMRLSDVAREIDVANSTAHRLLAALSHRGFVTQESESKRYRAGEALFEVGRASLLHQSLGTSATHVLAAVSADFDETTHLCVREGTTVRYLAAVESTRAVRVASRAGRALPAHCTSTGKVLLATLDDATIRRLYAGTALAAPTDRTITDLDRLLDELAVCRTTGYAVNVGESELDVVSVAIGLVDPAGVTVATVGLAAPQHRLDPANSSDLAAARAVLVEPTGRIGLRPAGTSTQLDTRPR